MATAIRMVRTTVCGHIRNAEIFLTAIFADIVGLFPFLVEFVVILRSLRMTDTVVGFQHGKAGKTLSAVLAVVIGHDNLLFE